jgi:hypothetical protein
MPPVARFQIHPRPRPPSFHPQEWAQTAWSDAGGRVPRRPVRVRYRYPSLDSPARTGRDGVVLLIFTLIGSPILLVLGVWALSGGDRTLYDWAGAALAFAFVAWWWYMIVTHFVRAIRGAGRRTVRGVAVACQVRTFHHWETREPYDIHFVGVDDGTSDECYGWEVPHEVHQAVVDGTRVEVVVSGDRRYLYTLDTTPID